MSDQCSGISIVLGDLSRPGGDSQPTTDRGVKRFFLLSIVLLTILPAVPHLAQVPLQVAGERVPGTYDGLKAAAEQQQLAEELLLNEGKAVMPGIRVTLREEERARLAATPANQGRLLVGIDQSLDRRVRFGDVTRRQEVAGGTLWLDNAGFAWFTHVEAVDATAVRLHFTELSLADGVELYVYTQAGEAYGPYTGRGPLANGELWSHTVAGAEIRIQLRYQGDRPDEVLRATRLVLKDVGHLGERFQLARPPRPADDWGKGFCGFNASCVQNAACSTLPAAIQPAADGVASLLFRVGYRWYTCSGGLLTDMDDATVIPYLLTANHCFSTAASAASLEAFFQYTTPCGGACGAPSTTTRVVGSTLLATSASSDYTFVRLSGSLPAGSYLLGWSSAGIAFSHNTPLYRLSHPKGAPQAYSTHRVDITKGTCFGAPRGDWIYSRDTFGSTEGGSSGSPVLNANGQVVGQLTGTCGSNTDNACDRVNNGTVDGALAAYFSQISQWLEATSCHVDIAGDYDYCNTACTCAAHEGDCDSDAQCNPGLTCVHDIGARYGWPSNVDVCIDPSIFADGFEDGTTASWSSVTASTTANEIDRGE